jgi:cytochrome c556
MRTIIVAVLALALAAGAAPSADKEKDRAKDKASPTAKLMQEKLKYSQRLLEGLALADFTKITDNAEELMRISKQAEWSALKTREYELHTNAFRRAIETTVEKAKAKNVDGAALGYVDMTLTCVRCHQYTREQRLSRLPADPVPTLALKR